MSLFGSSPPAGHDGGSTTAGDLERGHGPELFGKPVAQDASSAGLFGDGGDSETSPWEVVTPRKKQRRAEMIRNLLSAAEVPESYAEAFDTVLREDGSSGEVPASGIAKLFAIARLGVDAQACIMSLMDADGDSSAVRLGSDEFNVLLALMGLAQEGEVISLDDLPRPKLVGLTAEPIAPPVAELAEKPVPASSKPRPSPQMEAEANILRPAMDDPEEDPWNTPEVHKDREHGKANGRHGAGGPNGFGDASPQALGRKTSATRKYAAAAAGRAGAVDTDASAGASAAAQHGSWSHYSAPDTTAGGVGFPQQSSNVGGSATYSGDGNGDRAPGDVAAAAADSFGSRNSGGRTGNSLEERIVVMLMPEKEGIFLFQHHNYEVASQRRGSKVIRRHSDFVWLLDCLQKRYPVRVLPLLPQKRVALNGNHLSNDDAFIEKRRRVLARFLNALVRHPVLSQEQLVVIFLTVSTELGVWRRQATISVQDEFADKELPEGLEDSLPATLEDLFSRTRLGVRRSAELYINVCNIMDRLVKRTEGVAADHARVAMVLSSLTETSSDTYASETSEVPLLNDGLTAMSKHLRTCQTLLEDESRGWDEGVLEDLKCQRDALVSVGDMFDRRERLDRDNIPSLERRIQVNESRLVNLRQKPEGSVKPGEIDKVAEAIIKDKESIVQQHNRSVFVKECVRDELVTFQTTQYHIGRWNQDWAGERIKYAEMLADKWRRLFDALEGMPLGEEVG